MNILVTGGAGYIGSHTSIELINAKYNNIEVNEKTILSIKLIIRESTVNK